MSNISGNTQAILLLTAPLLIGRGSSSPKLLTPGEYKRLAGCLRDIKCQPADFLSRDAAEIMRRCREIVDEDRLKSLIERGFQLSQAIDHWQTRNIWIVSRADPAYPRRLKKCLQEDAPAVLYGCGNKALLETGGLAVVGSRHVDHSLVEYTSSIGQLAAQAGKTLVSGGARGIDQAAMRGALEMGGHACGILADSLGKTAATREHRDLILNGQLVLVSPYDPNIRFHVGHAMQRNKLIYAFSDAALVVSSDINKGGTWAGAVEQLDKYHFVPLFVRTEGNHSAGLKALQRKGALPWPEGKNVDIFDKIFDKTLLRTIEPQQLGLSFHEPAKEDTPVSRINSPDKQMDIENIKDGEKKEQALLPHKTAADILLDTVRSIMENILKEAMKEDEIAQILNVSKSQTRMWLSLLKEEGLLEKMEKPVKYIYKK